MYLSSLKIFGFKSFAFRTTIDFTGGITAIVGPNGCGKSNIVDSIRWVMGEQKYSALRSSKMEEIIFNGTSQHPAQNIVEVSLVIENNKGILPIEYEQVTITRRLYRSGESEYHLNNTKCRLKDITAIFMDTGMGSHSYSIIEQQMVSALVNDRKENRKDVFDEAAGIMKYKERKKEALNKLQANKNDLLRVMDLVIEIEKVVKSLKRQANKAKRYLFTKKKLQLRQNQFYQIKYDNIEKKLAPLKKQFQEQTDEKQSMNTQINQWIAESEKTAQEHFVLNQKLQEAQQNYLQQNKIYQDFNNKIQILKERIKNYSEEIEKQRNEKKDNLAVQDSFELQINQINQQLAEKRETIVSLEKQFSEMGETLKLEKKKKQDYLDQKNQIQKQISQKENTVHQLKNEFSISQQKIEMINQEIGDIQNQQKEYEKEYEDKNESLKSLTEQKNSILLKLEEIQEDYYRYEFQLNELLEQKRESLDAIAQKEKMIDKTSHTLQILNDSSIQNQIYTDHDRKMIDFFDEKKIDYYKMIEIINPEPQYNSLVSEMIRIFRLDFSLNIMLNQEILEELNLLDSYSFLIENPNFSISGNLPDQIQPFALLLNCNEEYQKEIERVFSFLYWVRSLDQLNFEEIPQGVVVCDSHQRIFDSRSGLYYKYSLEDKKSISSEIFGRKIKIEKLSQELTKNQEELKNLQELHHKHEEQFSQVKKRLDKETENQKNKQQELSQVANKIEVLKHSMEDIKKQNHRVVEKIQSQKNHSQKLNEKILLLNEQIEQNNKELEQLKVDSQQFLNEFDDNTDLLDELNRKSNELNIELIKMKEKENSLVFQQKQIQNQIESIIQKMNNSEKNIKEKESSIHQMNQESQELEKKMVESAKDQDDFVNLRNQLDQKMTQKNAEKNILDKNIKEFREKDHKIQQLIDQTRETIFEFEKEFEMIKSKLEELSQQNTQVDLSEEDENQIEETFDLEQIEQEIEKYSKQLQQIGNVNFEAVESYEKESERYDFYLKQQKDLEQAQQNLIETIEKINSEAEKKYLVTFKQVRENFKKIFTSLFAGGECDLLLEKNQQDPLDMDVKIFARPKGKKVQNITLLSGGEKALTSIALLFAIYLVKPSPFCIMDEVDAPLDDANVNRFLNMLKEFAHETQFILITHNKKTMEHAERLYGVTMQDPGVSKIVTVRNDLHKGVA